MASDTSLTLVLWPDPSLDALARRIAEEGDVVDVVVARMSRADSLRNLAAGLVDVALVPSVTALSSADDYDLYPAVAVSSWCAPFARLVMKRGLTGPISTVACDARFGQEALMARIVLREHYGHEPAFLPVEDPSTTNLLASHADAALLIGEERDGEALPTGALVLDLGQEWFEFTNYPMVWGVFVSRRGESDQRVIRLLTEAVADLEQDERSIESLVNDDTVRFRMDDLASAGLTELCELLFFYKVTEEVPVPLFASGPGDPSDDDDEDDTEFSI